MDASNGTHVRGSMKLDGKYLVLWKVGDLLSEKDRKELDLLSRNFLGKTCKDPNDISNIDEEGIIFFIGNVADFYKEFPKFAGKELRIVSQLSSNCEDFPENMIPLGQVPVNIHGVGLYVRTLFPEHVHLFENLQEDHLFQTLTEGNKVSRSHRKGIYLSKMDLNDDNDIFFSLLRCSTNLDGPTEEFSSLDDKIVEQVDKITKEFLYEPAQLNHVLAQIYENSMRTSGSKQKENKARIKAHSDKTKDMPENGCIAFTTFYEKSFPPGVKRSKDDPYDFVYKKTSVLSKLLFKLKECVKDKKHLKEEFTIRLYPNSVFIIPLSTNRLYIHEIVPPTLPPSKIPTRMGYIIRCSKTRAVYRGGKTFLLEDENRLSLNRPTEADMKHLKELYFKENTLDHFVDYGSIRFSMNNGDYLQPLLRDGKSDHVDHIEHVEVEEEEGRCHRNGMANH
jgi:hypothetical protein